MEQMTGRDIAMAVEGGQMSQEEALAMWASRYQNRAGEVLPPEPAHEIVPAQRDRGIQHAPIRIPQIEVKDRKDLDRVRRDLALVVESTSTQHEYERQMVEERARHVIAMPAVAILGVADGALEAVGYGISELAETFTYAATRTIRRVKEGFERGRRQ